MIDRGRTAVRLTLGAPSMFARLVRPAPHRPSDRRPPRQSRRFAVSPGLTDRPFAAANPVRSLMLLSVLWWVVGPASVVAQDTFAPQADPRDLGLLITPGVDLVPGEDRTVLVADENGTPVVGKLQFESGERRIVMLPSGRLTSVTANEITPTDRPFEPVEVDALAERLVTETFRGFKVKKTRRYLFIYNASEEFATGTSRILESMYPKLVSYCEKQGLAVHEAEVPLVVVMFATEDEFQTYRQMPEGVIAYYNGISNHVLMYERSKLAEVAPTIAVKQAISTVAHEGVHQVLHNIGVQPRLGRWAPWVSEGIPEYFSPTDIGRGIRWKGVGLVNDLRLHNLIEQSKEPGANFGSGDLIRRTVTAESLDGSGYAAAWALTYFLAKHRPNEFFEYLRELARESRPLEGESGDEQLARFTRHFGDDLAALETEMIRRVSKLPYVDPIENQPHYVVLARVGNRLMSIVTPSPAEVTKFRTQLGSQLSPAELATAQVTVDLFPTKPLAQQAAQAALR